MEEGYEERLLNLLRDHKLFKTVNNETLDKSDPPPRDIPANAFKKICEFSADGGE